MSERAPCLLSVDCAIAAVSPHAQEWKLLPVQEKSRLISECMTNLRLYHTQLEETALERRSYCLKDADKTNKDKVETFETEKAIIPLLTSTHLAFWLSSLRRSFDHIVETGQFPKPSAVTVNSDGTIRLNVTAPDYFTWTAGGYSTLELHVQNPGGLKAVPGHEASVVDLLTRRGSSNEKPATPSDCPLLENLQYNALEYFKVTGGQVEALLGAGNFDCPVDLLTAMFIENNVAVYKFSELSASLVLPFTRIFSPLVERGFLAFTSGGPKEGSQLLHHPEVSKWSMVGDFRTANRILFDSPESPFKDRPSGSVTAEELDGKLKLKKPGKIELGNCSPYIVAPGDWTDRELYRHARHLVFGLVVNGGHICARPQVLVTCKNWPQREQFLDYVREEARKCKVAGIFYPGGVENLQTLKEKLSLEGHDLDRITLGSGNIVFAHGAEQTSSILTQEAFCCVTAEFPLDTSSTISEFLPSAVEFANTKAYGSLAATIIAKTTTQEENTILDDCILKLQYGSVGVNISGLLSIYYPQLVWGGSPHNTDATHLQSGIGFFGNSHGFCRPCKSVIRSSFLGPSHFLQVVPQGREIHRFQKLLARTTRGLLNGNANLLDYMKIASALLFNL